MTRAPSAADPHAHGPREFGREAGGEQRGPRSAFRALMVGGVPIFADPFAPEGQVFFLNTNYMNMYIHEMASFAFTGFESTIANFQVGYIGAVLVVAELVSVKPSTMSRVTGLNSLTI